MTDKPYNTDLMLQIREQITAHPETHDQKSWARETACGTTLCVAGWAVELTGGSLVWQDYGPWGEEGTRRAFRTGAGAQIPDYAAKVLGLSSWDAGTLFYSDDEEALDRLDRLIAAGKNGERIPEGQL